MSILLKMSQSLHQRKDDFLKSFKEMSQKDFDDYCLIFATMLTILVIVAGGHLNLGSDPSVFDSDLIDIPSTCDRPGLISQAEFLSLRSEYFSILKVCFFKV